MDEFDYRIVHSHEDEWGWIHVLEHSHFRLLRFDSGFVQTTQDKFKPASLVHEYTRAMFMALAFSATDKAIILGLGGGCLARALRAVRPELSITAVELRPAVAHICKLHFGLPGSDLELVVADAFTYINQRLPATAGLIFSDLYHAQGEAPHQTHTDFVTACHRALESNGWLVLNLHQHPKDDENFFRHLCDIFPTTMLFSTSNENYILYAGKSAEPIDTDQNKTNILSYQKILGSRLDLILSETHTLAR